MAGTAPVDWLVLFATPLEGARVQQTLTAPALRTCAGFPFTLGRWPKSRGGSLRLAVAATGIGQVNAAATAATACALFRPRAVAHLGIAGGYAADRWRVGTVARAAVVAFGEDGVDSAAGWQDLSAIGFPLMPALPPKPGAWNRVPVQVARATVGRVAGFLSVVACSGDAPRARRLRARAARMAPDQRRLPWIEEMETAAVALVCARAGVPLLALRGISNVAGERDKRRWQIPAAAIAAQQALARQLCGTRAPEILRAAGDEGRA